MAPHIVRIAYCRSVRFQVVQDSWKLPSPPVAELIRRVTAQLLVDPEGLFEEIDDAVLALQPDWATGDPRVVEAIRASNRANLAHWGTSNIQNPGARVLPNVGPEATAIAREIVRHGFDDNSLEAYRVGQNIAWRHWMRVAFELSDDPSQLAEMLDITARSIFTFVDETLAGIHDAMEQERAQLTTRTHTELLEIVNLVLENAPIASQRASQRLRYDLSRRHTAAIIWTDELGPRDPAELRQTAEALQEAYGSQSPLTLTASPSALWAWFTTTKPPDLESVRAELSPPAGVRVAIGSTDAGIEGFRRSHLHALATQRLMRRAPGERQLAAYDDVQLVAFAAQDEARTAEFVSATLGDLAHAEPVLRETLRTYVREQCSPSRAARVLFTHRNTVLNRISRAEVLLPVSLSDHSVEIGLALEILHWLGPQGQPRAQASRPARA